MWENNTCVCVCVQRTSQNSLAGGGEKYDDRKHSDTDIPECAVRLNFLLIAAKEKISTT